MDLYVTGVAADIWSQIYCTNSLLLAIYSSSFLKKCNRKFMRFLVKIGQFLLIYGGGNTAYGLEIMIEMCLVIVSQCLC